VRLFPRNLRLASGLAKARKYVTNRFPSGDDGRSIAGQHGNRRIAWACDTRLLLENIPADTAKRFGGWDFG